MKYLPLPRFDVVADALNFDTPDCHVAGGCDVYTTKAAGGDKKLYRSIDESLESQHAASLKFGMSLSPPQRTQMAASLNLSRSSPFGPLSDLSSRKTFAYLIATLNASHPDYDFSHVLRPADFKRERNLRKVILSIDSTLATVRPNPDATRHTSIEYQTGARDSGSAATMKSDTTTSFQHMWGVIDVEMTLKDCTIFSYVPTENPFDDEAASIWSMQYFFFNKSLKRVAYLYARAVPVVSHSSPKLRPRRTSARASSPAFSRSQPGELKRTMSSMILDDDEDDAGASKRARFWLGDKMAEHITNSGDEEDDVRGHELLWNRSQTGELEDFDVEDAHHYRAYEEEDEISEDAYDDEQMAKAPVRGMSEEVAASMDVD